MGMAPDAVPGRALQDLHDIAVLTGKRRARMRIGDEEILQRVHDGELQVFDMDPLKCHRQEILRPGLDPFLRDGEVHPIDIGIARPFGW